LPALAELIVSTLWLLIPAYFANATPVVFPGSQPLDGGRYFHGQPLLGPGKTINGTIAGLLSGLMATLALIALQMVFMLPQFLPTMTLGLGSLLTVGALSGDILASFMKRRINLNRGDPLLLVDQLDFYLGAMVLSSTLFFNVGLFLVGLVITPPIHKLFNLLAFKVSLKDVSW